MNPNTDHASNNQTQNTGSKPNKSNTTEKIYALTALTLGTGALVYAGTVASNLPSAADDPRLLILGVGAGIVALSASVAGIKYGLDSLRDAYSSESKS